jgi:uncharacterized delta-60 repeat protein
VQPDNRILISGSAPADSGLDFAVVRLTAGGSLDTSFGSSGIALAAFSGGDATAAGMALQKDGSIVAVGQLLDETTNISSFAVARFTPIGALDSTFGISGEVVVSVNGEYDYAVAVALKSDGDIVVAGDTGTGLDNFDFAVVCLLGDRRLKH